MTDNKLKLRPINDLLGEKFLVPSYQRGFRWSKQQVDDLLNDIWKFRKDNEDKSKEVFYCLQPVVVSKNEGEWVLIDGQQRLTTIYLILAYLDNIMSIIGKGKYSIRYETRKDSEKFLQTIDYEKELDNVDYYHICNASKCIESWFNSKDGNTKLNFLNTLLNDNEAGKNVKIIWYEINDTVDHVDIFTRLNMGKIPLTNAELIKALFLQSNNFINETYDKTRLKQLKIASEWDLIERTLQNDSFWHFIHNSTQHYDTRIEYIFDLMMNKKTEDEHHFTFFKFNEEFELLKRNHAEIAGESLWISIKKYFLTFEEWYHNRELYHLIGYLITTKFPIAKLKEQSLSSKKSEFIKYLKERIKERVAYQLTELDYGNPKSREKIKEILLLFNIQTILSNQDSNIRFPFDRFKKEKWDIEHIRSQADRQVPQSLIKEWAKDILGYFGNNGSQLPSKVMDQANESFKEQLKELIESDKIDEKKFKQLYQDLMLLFKEDKEPENINAIENLTLLDATTNRTYKNAFFPIKRKTILENDTKGTFVPICTRNVFLKSYSQKVDELLYWNMNDSRDYRKAIIETLKEFIPPQNINNER